MGGQLLLQGRLDALVGGVDLYVSEGAIGMAVPQPEGQATKTIRQLLTGIAIDQIRLFQKGFTRFSDHLQHGSRRRTGWQHHRQISLREGHRRKGTEAGLPTVLAGRGREER